MINHLKKLKKTYIWELFITYVFYIFYSLVWTYIINFKAKFLKILWFKKKREFYNLNQNDKLIISDEQEFKEISELIKAETTKFLPDLKNKIVSEKYSEQIKRENLASGEIPYVIEFYDQISDNLKKKIVEFASSEKMVSTAANYMGIFPMITRIQLSLNIPRKDSDLRSAMLWHKDEFGFRNLDFFMTVFDLDDDSGPFYCVKKKIKAGVFKSFISKRNKIGERGKIDLEDFENITNTHGETKLIGSSGTAIFVDSFSTYHRGGFCKLKDRLMLRICYQSHDVLNESYKESKNEFLFDKQIRLSETKDIFQKYLYFNNKSKFIKLISNSLVKFYRLIEFKYN